MQNMQNAAKWKALKRPEPKKLKIIRSQQLEKEKLRKKYAMDIPTEK